MTITAYSTPNSLDTIAYLEQQLRRRLPSRHYRQAEIFACLQTLDDAMREVEGKSPRRRNAADAWRDLAGELLALVPVAEIRAMDPFRVARMDFPTALFPQRFRNNIDGLLVCMFRAANTAIGGNQRYVANYHGVISHQLTGLGLITRETCAAFHRDVIHLPVPEDHPGCSLVYPAGYDPDHMPRGSEDEYDISEYEHQTFP